MAYRLKLNEPIDDAVRRIAAEQIDNALHELGEATDRVQAVHEARKSLKRIRALLKLVRSGMPKDVYRQENRRFRDIARLLAGARDADVLAATATRMAEHASAKARRAASALVGEQRAVPSTAEDQAPHVDEAIIALGQARVDLATLRFEKKSFSVVRRGLERSYRDGRRAMHEVLDEHHDEAFHEWRKAVQAHWRHMSLLARAWPQLFEARSVLAKEISELLGEDHDLTVLIGRIASADMETDDPGGAELVAAARRRHAEIRAVLHPKGAVLYAEGASEFSDRIAAYWSAAKAARRLAKELAAEPANANSDDAGDGDDKPARAINRRAAAKPAKPASKAAAAAERKSTRVGKAAPDAS